MRVFLFLIIFLFTLPLLQAQSEGEWIYQVSFEDLPSAEPFASQTQVFVTVNLSLVPDSTLMVLKIGSSYGNADIYRRELPRYPELYYQPGVEFLEDIYAIRVNLGLYVIEPGELYVDVQMHYPY